MRLYCRAQHNRSARCDRRLYVVVREAAGVTMRDRLQFQSCSELEQDRGEATKLLPPAEDSYLLHILQGIKDLPGYNL